MRVVVACASGILGAAWGQLPPQTRDTTTVHTAMISGTVTTDDGVNAPLRRARVTLKGPDVLTERTIVTGDDGTFQFPELAAGRYALSAAKEAYLTTEYRATLPGSSGVPIVLTAGAKLSDVSIRLTRGSVIAGRVSWMDGTPLSNRAVSILKSRVFKGQRILTLLDVPAARMDEGNYTRLSDDQGNYRIYGLPPGEYVVAVGLEGREPHGGKWHITTPEEMERAKAGMSTSKPPVIGAILPSARNDLGSFQYAPVYYPGTTLASEAGLVRLGRSEERDGVDLQLMLTKTAAIGGTVTDGRGGAVVHAVVQVISAEPQVRQSSGATVAPLSNGEFHQIGLSPGRYIIEARTLPNSATVTGERREWAQADVVVTGEDIQGLRLMLQPCATIAGRVVVDGASIPPVEVTLTPELSLEGSWISVRTVTARNGHFEFTDVVPGRYRLSATLTCPASANATGLFFDGSTVGGREATDAPFELMSSQSISDAVAAFTNQPSRLSGVLVAAELQPAVDYFIVAFPPESAFWFWESRRIRVQHVATDGSFEIAGLPAGEYALAATTSLDPGDEFDPSFLQQLLAQSVRISIKKGAGTIQNLRIGK